ncbi:MAG: 1-aminocyclopropane-1-carboxylate deaminase/D-cysteine desulfhydrase [Planctomycetota bacterium]|jgi:D-cysteine desulfhydrase family pyridoxal phosphate-dependent enzyme
MSTIQEYLKPFRRLRNSLVPTPAHKLEYLSDKLDADLYCKRDDLTGFGFGGNKTRKLDFLLAQALERGCDTLIAIGANQSNFCRVAASYGVSANLEVHLVLGGAPPENPTGNLRIDHLLGVRCHHIDSADWDDWACEAEKLEKELTSRGRKVYRLPVGGSTPRGALGYVDAFAEILADQSRLGVEFDAIIHASSSAGTQAGLVIGQAITGWSGRIIGISVAKPRAELEREVRDLARATAAEIGAAVEPSSIIVDDRYIGAGYAARTAGCEEAVTLFARQFGIFLDYVYTGKAAAAVIDYLRKGRFEKGANVLFIHTGGNIELFE